jgi:hypothetical protein
VKSVIGQIGFVGTTGNEALHWLVSERARIARRQPFEPGSVQYRTLRMRPEFEHIAGLHRTLKHGCEACHLAIRPGHACDGVALHSVLRRVGRLNQ